MKYTIIPLMIWAYASSGFAQAKCSQLFEQKAPVQFEDIIGTKNEIFLPKPLYVEAFSKALKTLKPAVGNFSEMLTKLKDIRIQIAKKNSKDKELYKFMISPSSQNHFEGKLNDMTNVTGLYSYDVRYKDLYNMTLKAYDHGRFTHSNTNEFSKRVNKEGKQRNIENGHQWWLHYETLHGEKKPILISAVVAKSSQFDGVVFGVFNSFSKDIPRIRKHMEFLWDTALSKKSDRTQKAQAIAEFEWFFFQSNPLGRAAASIGDIMSLSLQNETGMKIRKEFVHLDFEALTQSKTDYVNERTQQMLQ